MMRMEGGASKRTELLYTIAPRLKAERDVEMQCCRSFIFAASGTPAMTMSGFLLSCAKCVCVCVFVVCLFIFSVVATLYTHKKVLNLGLLRLHNLCTPFLATVLLR